MKRIWIPVIILFATSLLAFQWPWAKKKEGQLTIQGSTTVLPIAQRAAEEFIKEHPNANITVRGGGSGTGIAALIDGTIDIANASRPMKTKELKTARGKGINPYPTIIAKDGIAVIVHPTNPVSELTIDQIRAIFCGDVSRWSDIGGKNESIVVVSRDVASGTFEVFKKLALKGEKTREDALMLASNMAVATTVEKTPGAICYVGLGYVSEGVKALSINGVVPTKETAGSGEYSLARPLYMYTNGEPSGLAKTFIDFILGPEGQKIVDEQGFVPVK